MCELYLSSSDRPHFPDADFRQLQRHGGSPWTNLEGWGLSRWDDTASEYTVEKRAHPAWGCETYRAHLDQSAKSRIQALHLRAASSGGTCLANTQPYTFKALGRSCLYLHNGELNDMEARLHAAFGEDVRDGTADSEGGMALLSRALDDVTSIDEAWAQFKAWGAEMRSIGLANFIVGLGTDIFVQVHQRIELGTDTADDPGLYWLRNETRLRLSSERMSDADEPLPCGTLLWIDGTNIRRRDRIA